MNLTQKQRIQLEIIDIDYDLNQIALRHPESHSLIHRIRDALANYVFLVDGTDIREFCACRSSLGEA